MRLTTAIVIATLLQVSAASFAQKITIHKSKTSLRNVLKELQLQSGFDFIYTESELDRAQPVSLKVSDAELEEVLELVFREQPLSYIIRDKTIAIAAKKKSFLDNLLSSFKQTTVAGKVTDSGKIPLQFVTVTVKGTQTRVSTNSQGEYSIVVPQPEDILVFSSVDMQTQEVKVAGRPLIDVVMRPLSIALEEVSINTGYQTIKQRKMTGATSTVTSTELDKRNATNILTNLEGRMPGLLQYNGATRVRGVGTLNASSDVLLVVDGFPIEGSIADINPYDVEGVTLLKDAAAAAIYGARASNGVIVILTKQANKKGKTQIDFSSNISFFEKPDYGNYNYMSAAQQVDFESNYYDYYFNSGILGTIATMTGNFESAIQAGNGISPVAYLHYQRAKGISTTAQLNAGLAELKTHDFLAEYKNNALENQLIQQYNMAVRVNRDNFTSSLVVNYKTDNLGLINASNRQLNLFYKANYTLNKWVEANFGINTIIGKVRKQRNADALNPFNVPAYFGLLNPDGSRAAYNLSDFNPYSTYNNVFETTSGLSSLKFNHLTELERDYSNTTSRNSRYFINIAIKPFSGLTISPQFQYEDNNTDISSYSEAQSYLMRWLNNTYAKQTGTGASATYARTLPAGGRLLTNQLKSPSYTARLQINFNKDIGKHSLNAIAGNEFRQTRSYGTTGGFFGYDDELQIQSTSSIDFYQLSRVTSTFWNAFNYPNSSAFAPYVNVFGLNTDTRHRYASVYANLTYTYDRKYTLFGSARKDYADLFGGAPKFRGSPLWSAGIVWNVNEEQFLQELVNFDVLKLRASYGQTGNIATNYTSLLTASIGGTQVYTNLPVATVTVPPNPNLRWEKTKTFNLGLDFAILKNRLNGALDFYSKRGTDLFARKRLDVTQGYSTLIINNGDMLNTGVEATINYEWLIPEFNGGFRWMSTLNLGYNKNRITYVDDVIKTPAALAGNGAFKTDYPVNSLFSYQYRGINANGQPQYLISNGSLVTGTVPSSDLGAVVYSGTATPVTNAAINNEVSWKGLSMSVYAVYYGGHSLRDNPPNLYSVPAYGALPSYLLNSWSPQNLESYIPGFGQYYKTGINNNQLRFADYFVKRADFMKIRTLILAYALPGRIAAKMKASSIKFRFQIDNPNIIWTKESLSIDPETLGLRIPTSYILGMNVNF
ncbi:SusC/RagA family TonB-linked outer membrane protein [Pedobacter jeongneungensis]|uniref:SusC/RagA family TonB-linked outer membrane protein n=1 Tax=Pedobacter jeongneungensis TaxID=947309 RepID=UPI00046A9F4B|nr:SusC/RagA family TonB-linked outer membrane protein [Pedobacter jeongneungensis]